MFKKLRKDFVLLNMLIIGALMIGTFAIVYFTMYQNTMSDVKNRLSRLPMGNLRLISRGNDISNNEIFSGGILPIDYSLSFNLFLNERNELIRVNSYVDMSEDMYQKAASTALSNKKEYGTMKLDNRNWMYRINKNVNLPHNDLPNHFGLNGQIIVFLDITDSITSLNNLLIIFFIVGVLMLVVIYFISVYFAKRSVKGIEEAWGKQKQFIADASHEFKTPIAVIDANADALLLELKSNNKKWIDYIKVETTRMNKLVTDLLYLAKTEDMDTLLEQQPFNISDVVNKVIRSHEVIIYERNLSLEHNIEPDIEFIGDASKLEQVIVILIDNAIKYTNEFGEIDIKLIKDKKTIELSVSNTGKGIEKEDISKVFDRFYRIDTARTGINNSYGLGLSIAKTIIERMGGKIFVTSIPNEITKFTIVLKIK